MHPDWNTLIFNYGRHEVANFLLGNALFWLDHYHIDGLRVDAVASMLYLDYSRKPGEWVPNMYGGNENLEAIAFLRRLNELAYGERPGRDHRRRGIDRLAGRLAPDLSRRPRLRLQVEHGLDARHARATSSEDPVYRKYHHDQLTFGLIYAFTENFVLPLSHDEVVHGKGSLLGKMPGDLWQKFANLRAYYGFMFGHPGKKLLFMGGEFAQGREWNHDTQPRLAPARRPAPSRRADAGARPERALSRAARRCTSSTSRPRASSGSSCTTARRACSPSCAAAPIRRAMSWSLCNFTPVPRHGYRVGVPQPGYYRELLNTDAGGLRRRQRRQRRRRQAEDVGSHGRPHSLSLTLPPLGDGDSRAPSRIERAGWPRRR